MAQQERVYTIPLRQAWLKAPRVKRSNRAVSEIRRFLTRHMHAKDVRLSQNLNSLVWISGAKKPPAKVKVKAVMVDDVLRVMLPDEKFEKKKEQPKAGLKEKLKAAGLVPEKVKDIEDKAKHEQAKPQAAKQEKVEPVKHDKTESAKPKAEKNDAKKA